MIHSFKRRFRFAGSLLLPIIGAVLFSGCGGGGSGPAPDAVGSSGGTGTLRVVLADAPDPDITAINVTIDRVEAHVNNQWVPITTVPATFNLFDLVHDEALLGSANLPAGRYNQIRFFPSSATVVDSTGTHNVTIPGAVQTGVKVNVNYDIEPNQITTILLDFNVGKSLRKLGNGRYQLQPVVPAVVKVLSGTITGLVTDNNGPVAGADIKAIYTAGSSYPVGTEVNTTFTLDDGSFKVWALLPGTYRIEASHTDSVTNTTKTATKNGVVVTADANTNVGTLVVQ